MTLLLLTVTESAVRVPMYYKVSLFIVYNVSVFVTVLKRRISVVNCFSSSDGYLVIRVDSGDRAGGPNTY